MNPAQEKSYQVVRSRQPIFSLLLALLSVLLFASSLWAQSGATGALAVTVTDPSSAIIAGATVTASNAAGVTRSLTTDNNGTCTFNLLPPGNYRVSISAPGFQPVEVQQCKDHRFLRAR